MPAASAAKLSPSLILSSAAAGLAAAALLTLLTLVPAAHVHNHGAAHGVLSTPSTTTTTGGGSRERVSDGSPSITTLQQQHLSQHANGSHNESFDHQAILGSKKQAAEFDRLSDRESIERLRSLVTTGGLDADANGHVDMIELKDWILKSFRSLTQEDGAERHADEDSDKVGPVLFLSYSLSHTSLSISIPNRTAS